MDLAEKEKNLHGLEARKLDPEYCSIYTPKRG